LSGLVAKTDTVMFHLYGLIIGIAIIIGVNYFSQHQTAVPVSKINFFIFGTIFSAIIGARAYHVIDQWSFYSQHPSLIYQTWNGGLGIFGGIIGSLIFILIFNFFNKINLLTTLDAITPILPLCQAIGRFGNYFNRENPMWWLEASLNLILFFILRLKKLKPYSSTSLYLIGYGFIRLITEFWRHDTWVINNIKIGQIISIIFILIGLLLINRESIKIFQNHHQKHPLVS